MPTLKQAIEKYGAIDFAAKWWPRQADFMVMLDISHMLLPNFKVTGTDHRAQHIYCNIDMAQPLRQALHEIEARGHGAKLLSYDGCLNIRMVRGSAGRPSAHAYGLAIDLNAHDNPLGSTHGGFFDEPEIVKCFKANGFDWGGDFKGRKDPMHFSYCWEHSA